MAGTSRLTNEIIERASTTTNDLWLSDDDGSRGHGRLVVRINVCVRPCHLDAGADPDPMLRQATSSGAAAVPGCWLSLWVGSRSRTSLRYA